VRTSELGQPVTIRWEELGGDGVLARAVLVDEATGEQLATPPGGSHTFTPEHDVSRFRLVVDQPAVVFADGFETGHTGAWSLAMP